MSQHEQMKAKINGMDISDEAKKELNTLTDSLAGTHNEVLSRVATEKEAKNTATSKLKEFQDKFEVTDVSEYKPSTAKGEDEIRAELTNKYDEKYLGDIKTLNDSLKAKDDGFTALETKYNDSQFNNAVVNSGLLDSFVDEPLARQNIIAMIKNDTIFKDGNIYQKDKTTGDIAKEIGSDKYLGVDSVIDGIKSTINPMYLKPDTQANGGGMPNNQANQQPNSEKPIDIKKHKNVGSFMNEAMNELKK